MKKCYRPTAPKVPWNQPKIPRKLYSYTFHRQLRWQSTPRKFEVAAAYGKQLAFTNNESYQ